MGWFIYSFFAAVALAIHFLLLKKMSINGTSLSLLTLYMWGLSSILLLVFQLFKKQLALPKGSMMIVVIAGLTTLIGTLLLYKGVSTAPNPGYAVAVGSLQVLIVVISSDLNSLY